MTKEELEQYKVTPTNFWQSASLLGSGYDVADHATGWTAIPSWGRDGWDLGNWPLVMVFCRTNKDSQEEVVYYVEGDVTMYRCPTQEIHNAIIDDIAFFHWKFQEKQWVKDYQTIEDVPADSPLRGPFSWERLEQWEKEQEEQKQQKGVTPHA